MGSSKLYLDRESVLISVSSHLQSFYQVNWASEIDFIRSAEVIVHRLILLAIISQVSLDCSIEAQHSAHEQVPGSSQMVNVGFCGPHMSCVTELLPRAVMAEMQLWTLMSVCAGPCSDTTSALHSEACVARSSQGSFLSTDCASP